MNDPLRPDRPMHVTTLAFDAVRLDLRRGVGWTERTVDGARLVYLSLLEDEITARADACALGLARRLAAGEGGRTAVDAFADACANVLDLVDAFVWIAEDARTIVVARGGSCTIPLYRAAQGGTPHLSARLPVDAGDRVLSRIGLVAATLNVGMHGSFDPDVLLDTPLADWQRVRRGRVTVLARGVPVAEAVVVHRSDAQGADDPARIAERLATGFADYGRSQRHVTRALVELSGGYDSTLAVAAVLADRRGSPDRPALSLAGVSVTFPWYEFRLEADVQVATARALGIGRRVLDGTQLLPYAPTAGSMTFDEPTGYVTGLRHVEAVVDAAREMQAERLYVGHGGDHLFARRLDVSEPPAAASMDVAAFTPVGAMLAASCESARRRHPALPRASGCFAYDARIDAPLKAADGITVRTPFTDLAIFRCALAWSAMSTARGFAPDKEILADALPDLLPEAVRSRYGKVAYDGAWMRARAQHGEHVAATIERHAAVLETIGFAPPWLVDRVRRLARWEPLPERETLAAFALAAWLEAWRIDRPAAARWVDGASITPR